MPNGHGGIPRYGSAVTMLLFVLLAYVYYRKEGWAWLGYAGYVLAAALGWRFAHGLHMWKATDYGGAYTSDDAMHLALGKYAVGSVAYAAAAMAAWYFLT